MTWEKYWLEVEGRGIQSIVRGGFLPAVTARSMTPLSRIAHYVLSDTIEAIIISSS